jgi:hypothetical protein
VHYTLALRGAHSYLPSTGILLHQVSPYLRTWFAHLRTKPSVAKRKRKNKSRQYPLFIKRHECPLSYDEKAQNFDPRPFINSFSIPKQQEWLQNSIGSALPSGL